MLLSAHTQYMLEKILGGLEKGGRNLEGTQGISREETERLLRLKEDSLAALQLKDPHNVEAIQKASQSIQEFRARHGLNEPPSQEAA